MGYSSLALWDYPAGLSDIKSVTTAALYELHPSFSKHMNWTH